MHLSAALRGEETSRLIGVSADTARLQDWQSAFALWLVIGSLDTTATAHLLDAFACYLDRCDGAARLIALGDGQGNPSAMNGLRDSASTLNLTPHVEVVEIADDACRKAALLSADALLVLGACGNAPLEALSLGTPIVGWRSPSTTDLVADAGLLWEERAPELLAASIERLRNDACLRANVRERGFARVSWMATGRGMVP